MNMESGRRKGLSSILSSLSLLCVILDLQLDGKERDKKRLDVDRDGIFFTPSR